MGCQKFDEVIEQKDYLHWHIETKRKRQKKGGKKKVLRGIIPSRGDGSAGLIGIPSQIGVVTKFSNKEVSRLELRFKKKEGGKRKKKDHTSDAPSAQQ